MRRQGLAAVVAVGLAGCGTSQVVSAGDVPVQRVEVLDEGHVHGAAPDDATLDAQLDAVLAEVAAAFATGDVERLRPHLLPGTRLSERWTRRLDHLAGVPLRDLELRLGAGLGDLADDAVRDRHDGPVVVRWVQERFRIDGFDDRPAVHDLFLTFHETADGWQLVSDTDAERLGLVSADHLWDHGPVVVTGTPPVAVLHHPGQPDATTVAAVRDEALAALATVRERWSLAWPGAVALVVPRDADELAELLHVTFELDGFIAFATSTTDGELGAYALTGSRVVVNPDAFLAREPAVREQVLVHELVHIASRTAAGPSTPSWLDEGAAQAVGERRSTTGTGLVATAFRDGAAGALPVDADFTDPDRDRVLLSYQQAWSFVDHLVDTHGTAAVTRFYAELGDVAVGAPGTPDHHVDRAALAVFGADLATLRAAWAATDPTQ